MHPVRAAIALVLWSCVASPAPGEPMDDPEPTPDPGAAACVAAAVVTQRCGPISSTSYLSLADRPGDAPHEVVLVDAGSGDTCTVVTFSVATSIDGVTSLASIGTDVYFCATAGGRDTGFLTKVSLVDGSVDTATQECMSLTAFGGKLVVLRDITTTLYVFDDFEHLASPTTLTIPECGNRLGFGDDRLFSTFSTPTKVFVYEPTTKAATSFEMPPSSMGVYGLAAHDSALTILDGIPDTQALARFHETTGVPVSNIAVGEPSTRLHGLTNTCSGSVVLL